jgi:prepilin-type N-terminal cleavage/methylation domain-containing protein
VACLRATGFTLVEMMVVMTLAAILMGMVAFSMTKAREMARKAKAEAQLREMVAAWTKYYELYGKWPPAVDGNLNIEMPYKYLSPLIDKTDPDNPLQIIFLNVALSQNDTYRDPWKTPYQLTFRSTGDIIQESALRTSVHFPNRQRRVQ